MRDKYIIDYEKGDLIKDYFIVVADGNIINDTRGSITIKDKTSEISCVCWEENLNKIGKTTFESFKAGNIVEITGNFDLYKDKPQIKIENIRLVDNTDIYDETDLYKTAPIESKKLYDEIMHIINTEIDDIQYREVCKSVYTIHKERLLKWPAAKSIHHAYEGGLLWHTYRMSQIALNIIPIYPKLNKSLLLAGILLHDIGKISEFSFNHIGIDYTLSGNTLGHILIGTMLVNNVVNEQGLPTEKKVLLEHMIASHHGLKDWGAIKEPCIMEAILLHEIDMIDSQLTKVEEKFEDKNIKNGDTTSIKIGDNYITFYKPTFYDE